MPPCVAIATNRANHLFFVPTLLTRCFPSTNHPQKENEAKKKTQVKEKKL
jgi:hypothetical protein